MTQVTNLSITIGGFFIALIKRINKSEESLKYCNSPQKNIAKIDRGFSFVDEETRNWIKNYYGLIDEFPLQQLITHSEKEKKINFVSTGVYNFLKSDKRNNLNIINCGVKMFEFIKLNDIKHEDTHCRYRVCQDGMLYLIPFMRKRVFFCNINFFVKILQKKEVLVKVS